MIHGTLKPPPEEPAPSAVQQVRTGGSSAATRQSWHRRVWRTARRYPIPVGAMILLLASLVFWLAGRGDIASWVLLAVVLSEAVCKEVSFGL